MTQNILCIVHQETSTAGLVGQLLQQQGYALNLCCPALGDRLPPSLDDYAAAIVFGGPMSANDDNTLPFIRAELDWLSVPLTSGKPFLGICLGAQLLARVLGGVVAPHPEDIREIGYFPLTATPLGSELFSSLTYVYHWHSEGFTLPQDTVLLAQGETFSNQAFRYRDNIYGLQFHPEITQEMLEFWTTNGAEQLSLTGAQTRSQQFQNHARYHPEVAVWLQHFLRVWLKIDPPSKN
ncbi:MAG: glutamine amidotransferase [Jaaginema sp. PMC 1079.18]|nr:glutamine amidotransferase [Jaaginema sp. PMC 1080.18]MEC4853802.1 glutamine amidotransferase [Jaaginema sp. PMC 1079.18]MEC4867544.1 glutamine amidotransferase [Jaaginema sp. PMC 1078.18]